MIGGIVMQEPQERGRPNKDQFFKECIDLEISNDKMTAYLLYYAYPLEELTAADFLQFLKSHQIMYGIDEQLLRAICENPGQFSGKRITIAKGDPPVDGIDAKIELRIKGSTGHSKPMETDQGRVDFRNIDNVTNVKAGELLLVKTPATTGTPGMTITGQRIEAKPGKNHPIKIGKNVVLDQSGLNLYSVIDGQISITEKERVNVFPVYEVNGDVDYSVGNIDFIGTVVIRGNVLAGFNVKAGGDIRVLGEVEGAELEAAGNIEIRAGIVAQGKGSIKAGNNVIANFINQANVYAMNDVIVAQSIMHSNIKADHHVICRSGKGLIVGGRIQAGEKIEVNIIGNTMSTPTTLEVGIMPDLINEYNSIKQQITQLQTDLESASKGIALLERQLAIQKSLTQDKQELRIKLTNLIMTIERKLPELEARKLEIEESLEMVNQARIDVYHNAYPGTKLIFGKYTRYLKLEHSRISFRLADGEITAIPL